MSDKWILTHAIHKGTLISRDIGNPQEFDSEEDALTSFNKSKNWYERIGYMIWWAYLESPDGDKQLLEQNSYY